MDTAQILQGVEIFKGLSPKELEAVAGLCELQKFKAGDVVFTEKSRGKDIYIIVQGQVAIELNIRGAKDRATVHRMGKGELFGELSLVSKGRSATVRCDSNCETIVIKNKALLDLFKDDQSLGCKVMTNLAAMLAAKLRKTNLQLIACFAWE